MASNLYLDKILQRITENTNTMSHVGQSSHLLQNIPPYKYHWVRDSALVMRTFIDMYSKTKEPFIFNTLSIILKMKIKFKI